MTVTDMHLRYFKPWDYAKVMFRRCSPSELDILEERYEELYPEGISAGQINDDFWFGRDELAQYLGYSCAEDMGGEDDAED